MKCGAMVECITFDPAGSVAILKNQSREPVKVSKRIIYLITQQLTKEPTLFFGRLESFHRLKHAPVNTSQRISTKLMTRDVVTLSSQCISANLMTRDVVIPLYTKIISL